MPGEVVVAEVLPADVALGGGSPTLMHLLVFAQVSFRHTLVTERALHFLAGFELSTSSNLGQGFGPGDAALLFLFVHL